jgi:hypothetical protein
LETSGHGALTRTGLTVEGSVIASVCRHQRLVESEGRPEEERHLLRDALQQIEDLEQANDTLGPEIVRQGEDLPGLRHFL